MMVYSLWCMVDSSAKILFQLLRAALGNEALGVLYNSDTFALIQDVGTGLYYQSAGYVYSYLEEELNTGKDSEIHSDLLRRSARSF